jgi:hypothetical protein
VRFGQDRPHATGLTSSIGDLAGLFHRGHTESSAGALGPGRDCSVREVTKLKAARQRKKERVGNCEGRKAGRAQAERVVEAKRLRQRSPKGHQRSLREVAAELAKLGYVNERVVILS